MVMPAKNNGQSSSQDSMLADFFSLDRWLTPKLVKVLYAVGVIAVVLGGGAQIISGLNMLGGYAGGAGWSLILLGALTLIAGTLIVRILAELILVVFRIHESLEAQRAEAKASN
mgnify:CR=1 FL=1